MTLEWYKNIFNIVLQQTLSECNNQYDNHCCNVTLHFNLFNIALRHYEIGVYNIGFIILRFIIYNSEV